MFVCLQGEDDKMIRAVQNGRVKLGQESGTYRVNGRKREKKSGLLDLLIQAGIVKSIPVRGCCK
ncbi:MAG: hypothetical protein HQM16_10785 [Deltaproteobacteria bacterium]|nr:hypothetical protein [Deltaproteobacteria bacterium]